MQIEWCCGFFFQAEDGIRDLVRSRGLGDVYKRQVVNFVFALAAREHRLGGIDDDDVIAIVDVRRIGPVSYTHLTLPTSDLV